VLGDHQIRKLIGKKLVHRENECRVWAIGLHQKECYNFYERSILMVTIELSKEEKLVLPESLGRSLGLREGDQVEVRRQSDILWFRRKERLGDLGPLTDLSRIISSSRPVGSVDVEAVMDKHGYEQVNERPGL